MKKSLDYSTKVMRSLACLSVVFLLVSCGEGSNLADPQQNSVVTICSDLTDIECANGYFVDDVVGNLNYECGKVKAVTGSNGAFSCPVGSDVIFSIINPDDIAGKKIILGKTKVKANSNIGIDNFLYIRPSNLSGNEVVATNIARLLQTFGSPITPSELESPARALFVLDADKKKLTNLAETIDGTIIGNAFESGTAFEAAVQPFLSAIPKTLVGEDDAKALLKKSLYSTVAGVYFNPGYFAMPGVKFPFNNDPDFDYGGMRGLTASNYFLGATWTAVDRKGRMFGFGVYSTASTAIPANCKFLPALDSCGSTDSPGTQPDRLAMRIKAPSLTSLWPLWQEDNSWAFSYELLNAAGNAISGDLQVRGVVDRDAMAGSDARYRTIYGEAPSASALIGSWNYAPLGFSSSNTRLTLVRSRSVASTLDPDLWAVVKSQSSFPMNVLATFYDAGCNPAPDPDLSVPRPRVNCTDATRTLRFTILEDGNIVSNLSDHCGANIDSTTLVAPGAVQEYPLGTIAQVFSTNSATRIYMSPIIIIPDNPVFGGLRSIQIGTSSLASGTNIGRVRLRADNGTNKYLHSYNDAALNSNGEAVDIDPDLVVADWSAYWNNQRLFLRDGTTLRTYDGVFKTEVDPGC